MKLGFVPWFVQLILSAGALLLLTLIVLSGSVDHYPFNRFYWIEADTSNITNAPDISRWTFWGLAERIEGKSKEVDLSPAYPFSLVDNFSTTVGVPHDFVDNRDTYYYLSRFAFAFLWVGLAFMTVVCLLELFAIFSYSVMKINGYLTTVALLFVAGAISFETAVCVMGRDAFSDANLYAHLGAAMLGMGWAATAILIILFFMSWGELILTSYRKHKARVLTQEEEQRQYDQAAQQQDSQFTPTQVDDREIQGDESSFVKQKHSAAHESGIRFFKIRRAPKEDNESV